MMEGSPYGSNSNPKRAPPEIVSVRQQVNVEHAWAANHLPKVHHVEDIVFAPETTLGSVAAMFKDGKFVGKRRYAYEPRTLRIIVQEELHTLRSLGSVKDIGQVLVDVACRAFVVFCFLICMPSVVPRSLQFTSGSTSTQGSFIATPVSITSCGASSRRRMRVGKSRRKSTGC